MQKCNWVVISNVVLESCALVIGNWYPPLQFVGLSVYLNADMGMCTFSSYISSLSQLGGLLLTAKTSKLIKTLNVLSLAADDAILPEILSPYLLFALFPKVWFLKNPHSYSFFIEIYSDSCAYYFSDSNISRLYLTCAPKSWKVNKFWPINIALNWTQKVFLFKSEKYKLVRINIFLESEIVILWGSIYFESEKYKLVRKI